MKREGRYAHEGTDASADRVEGALLAFLAAQDGALSTEEIAEFLELETHPVYEARHWEIHRCSAVTGEGLVDGVDWMVRDIASRIFMME